MTVSRSDLFWIYDFPDTNITPANAIANIALAHWLTSFNRNLHADLHGPLRNQVRTPAGADRGRRARSVAPGGSDALPTDGRCNRSAKYQVHYSAASSMDPHGCTAGTSSKGYVRKTVKSHGEHSNARTSPNMRPKGLGPCTIREAHRGQFGVTASITHPLHEKTK